MADDAEMPETAMLGAAKARLREEGWCIVPDALDAQRTAQALKCLWVAAEASERKGAATYVPMLDPNPSNIRVFCLMELDAIFLDLIQHPLAIEMVRAVLGPTFSISNFSANIARPGSRSMALHSDQSLLVPGPWAQPWSVNIIWCLTDTMFENGATLFIPGSHNWREHSDVPPDADKLLRPFEARAGSIIVMDGRVWHTSGANVTKDQDRALLFGYYSAPFLRSQINWNVGLSQKTQATLNPQLREWLGLELTANTALEIDLRYLDERFAHSRA